MNNILIYGFGRMGLTHYAILNQLLEGKVNFTMVDPNKKLTALAKKNLNAQFKNNDNALEESFDYTLICTPPMFHIPTLEKCLARGDRNIFIEKPFGGNPDDFSVIKGNKDKCKIGYVLRFNPIINWVKENVDISRINRVEGSYFSHTIDKKPNGWRNGGTYSGVLNEMGCHVLDLAVHLFDVKNFELLDKRVESKITDAGDIVEIQAKEKNIDFNFRFDWINKTYRKPIFTLKLHTGGGYYFIDQQKVEQFKGEELIMRKTVVDLAPKVPFYLRGIDFTRQMMDFSGSQTLNATVEEALVTRNLIKEILK